MSEMRRLIEKGASDAELALLRAGVDDDVVDDRLRASALNAALGAASAAAVASFGGKLLAAAARLVSHWAFKTGIVMVVGGAVGVGTWTHFRAGDGNVRHLAVTAAVGAHPPAVVSAVASAVVSASAPPWSPPSPPPQVEPPVVARPSAPTFASTQRGVPAPSPAVTAAPSSASSHATVGALSGSPQSVAMGGSGGEAVGTMVTDRAPDRPAEPPRTPPESALASEVAVLEEARGALAAHQTQRALEALNRYGQMFHAGALAQEATVMRIEALLQAGDRAGATRVADAFTRGDPDGPYAKRVRRMLDR